MLPETKHGKKWWLLTHIWKKEMVRHVAMENTLSFPFILQPSYGLLSNYEELIRYSRINEVSIIITVIAYTTTCGVGSASLKLRS